MDEMKKIEIIFKDDGSVVVEAFGFKGSSCEEATAFLDRIFGERKREYKSSYYENTEKIAEGIPSGYCG